MLSLSISYPYLIKFHDFAHNSQEGMKHQMGGASQAQQCMTFHITLIFTFFLPWEPDPSQNVGPVLRLNARWEPSFRFSWRFSYPVLIVNRIENWRRFSAGGWEPPNTGLQVVQQVGDELLGNIVGNIWGTWWEHRKKKISSSPLAPPKRKNEHSLGCMFSSFIGCMHILFLDMVAIIATANTLSTKQAYLLKLSSGWIFVAVWMQNL